MAVPALVVATYRNDELDRVHPLRTVLGELATGESIERLEIEPLSAAAVATLAEPYGVDADELFRKTAGNPFFVTEALAAGEGQIPPTVRDAVLARAAHLGPRATALLEAIAVVPQQAELWLVEALADDGVDRLEECASSGVLRAERQSVSFRHELARLAIEESLAPNRRVTLNRKALTALADPPTGAPDFARLAHHAEAAANAVAVLQFAPAAAERAASLGAHREAAGQWARALRFADGVDAYALGELLDRHTYECYLTDEFEEAIKSGGRAIECYRKVGQQRKEGNALWSLSRVLWCACRNAQAEEAGHEAIALLEQIPPGRELAMAYSNLSQIRMNKEDREGTVAWGTRAIELAERLDELEILCEALTNTGAIEFLSGASEGRQKLERSLELAQNAGLEGIAGRTFSALVWAATRRRSYEDVNRYLEAGLDYCSVREFDIWRHYLLAQRARCDLDQGHWTEALGSVELVLRRGRQPARIVALVVLGLVRARRGDPESSGPLDEALALAVPTGELQHIAPVAAARAEAAWLAGDPHAVVEATETALELAERCKDPWLTGELHDWRRRAGVREDTPAGVAEPYAAQIAGEWGRAAALWSAIGCPYEAALALAEADEEGALLESLAELRRLGAGPAATIVARRLRERGALKVPRGPRPKTRRNPANLTSREVEVLVLVAQGLHNSEIAGRLFLAEKTVDHHVSAILRKLGVRTRGQASTEAVRLGLIGQDG